MHYIKMYDIYISDSSHIGEVMLNELFRKSRMFVNNNNLEQVLGYRHLLSKKLELLYRHKNMELDKLGVFDEVGLQSSTMLC